MAVNLPTGYTRTTSEPIDALYLATNNQPYASVAAANTAIVSGVRYIGQFVNVNSALYWYGSGTTDPDLVPFSGGGGAIAVYDEGSLITSTASSFDFTGVGVTATAIGNAVTINIPNTYGGASPSTITVGGITVGSAISGQTYDQLWQALLAPYTAPTITVQSITPSSAQNYNELNVSCAVTFRWVKTAGTPDLSSAQIEFRRGGVGSWTTLPTTTSPTAPYTGVGTIDASASVTVNTSTPDNNSVDFRCIFTDLTQSNTSTTAQVTFLAYAAPTASLTLTPTPALSSGKFIRSFTTYTDTTISGTITRNSANINLNTYKIQRSFDNVTWTDLIGLTSISASGGTLAANGGNVVDSGSVANENSYYARAFVTDAQVTGGQAVSSVASYGFYQPVIYGMSGAATPAGVVLSTLTNVPQGSGAGQVNYTNTASDIVINGLVFTASSNRFCIAFDNSYGALSTFFDTGTNLNLISNFSSGTQVVTFGDGTVKTYIIYLYNTVVVSGSYTINTN
jgi:hypothetical protein